MNILIVGFGSIGQRHLQNLLDNYPNNKYYVLKKPHYNNVIKDCQVVSNDLADYYKDVAFIDSIDDIDYMDTAFICNNTSDHLATALKLSKQNINLFIEKPLSHNSKDLDSLKKNLEQNKSIMMIGFQTKFNPIYLKLQKLIENEKITFVNSKWLTYLPNWHKYEDYKKSYTANESLGGGVALTLVHELDMLNSLFGSLELINSISGNFSNLDIKADDYLMANFKSQNRAINLHLSFAQVKEERTITINSSDKTIVGDFVNNTIEIYYKDEVKLINFELERNKLFKDEVEYFFKSISNKGNCINTIDESIELQLLIDKMKENI
ncbi:Gfo/Idh/MocA family oxidoreductase [bacterium]|jgi:predicted dehydrogenase|nr:Gfo/Idh/MocA family oxidoreductase [bacterium]